ncbi:nidogen-like domain-containing protein [Chitinivorax sp. PXF-14]|uniref:nidogen-like domain-containing protein n=1 Tax=Chitinivorax sp. PXF-14 TaxID=3230488 RepID=UPI003465CC94
MFTIKLSRIALAAAFAAASAAASAGAIHDANLFNGNTLAANDDGSTGAVNVGFTLNFFGVNHTQLFVNNNGNVTFNSQLSTYTPFGLTTNSFPIIAPFFADVDTRGINSSQVKYGQNTLGGHAVFGVNWINVGYYPSASDKLNSFQLILTDRSDVGAGDFDIEFNYDQILWETGSASGGSGGFGGTSAAVGYTDGGTNDVEFAGSRVNGAFLDSNLSSGLVHNALGSNTLGQYRFNVRNGTVVVDPGPVNDLPEPTSLALLGLGCASLALARRRKA